MIRTHAILLFILFSCSHLIFVHAQHSSDTLSLYSLPGENTLMNDSINGSASSDLCIDSKNTEKKLTIFFKYPDEVNKKRLATVLIAEGTAYVSSFFLLNELWYKKYPRSSFHFFDDSREWMQMDKWAHMKAASTVTGFCYHSFRWAGVEKEKAILYGAALSFSYMTTIEILDGLSSQWGFSIPDMSANLLGTALYSTQEIFLGKRKVKLKMSYHPTRFAKYRPEVLGSTFVERVFKDYNGQTQWISVSAGLLMPKSKIPPWLSISVGYGAEGMLGGFSNPEKNQKGVILPHFERYRQFYLSFDIDLVQIHSEKKWVNTMLKVLNIVKIPFPALEYNTLGKFKFHYLYF